MEGKYLGIDGDTIEVLGKIVAMGGRLEGIGRDIAKALSLDVAPGEHFKPVMKAIGKQVSTYGVPSWARTDTDAVLRWRQLAIHAMELRNIPLHSVFVHSYDWQPRFIHISKGKAEPYSVLDFNITLDKMTKADRDGRALLYDLLHEIKPDVYMYGPVVESESPVVLVDSSDPGFPRPTWDDIEAYWDAFNAGPLPPMYPNS